MPVQLKEAIIRPKLKKESLDHKVYSNFRPISNLKFMSKMIEITDDVKYGKTEKCTRAADDVQTHSNMESICFIYCTHTCLVPLHSSNLCWFRPNRYFSSLLPLFSLSYLLAYTVCLDSF